jgi:TPR repeat protein
MKNNYAKRLCLIVLCVLVLGFELFGLVACSRDPEDLYNSGIKSVGAGNPKNGFKLFYKAANKGHVYAQYRVGLMYYTGAGIEKNNKEALKWLMKSAQQGNNEAQLVLADMYLGEQNYMEAFKWIIKSAQQGNKNAQYTLANMYYRGVGVKQNFQEAINWYRRSQNR